MSDTNRATVDQKLKTIHIPAAPNRGGLASRSFLSLAVTHMLGAMNDNIFRWLVVPIGKHLAGPDDEALALSAGLACLVLPYILLAAPSAYLADRFSKRTVIIACKAAEIVIMAAGIGAIWYGNIYLLFAIVFLMGAQSALFGPSKLGSIPEILKPEKISSGNGIIGLVTVIAVVAGTVIGNYLYHVTGPDGRTLLWVSALVAVGVAVVGTLTSFGIGKHGAGDPGRPFPVNFVRYTIQDLRLLGSSTAILRVAVGSAFFWSLASLAQLNVDVFGQHELLLSQKDVAPLLAVLSLGVGLGSVLAGVWSAGHVELGLVPLGATGIALSSILLFTVPDPQSAQAAAYGWSCLWLLLLGTSAGLYDVPLSAFLQHRSPANARGSILAAANFLVFSGMLAVSGIFWLLRDVWELSARTIFLGSGLLTLGVALYAFLLLPQATIRFAVWLATHSIYRIRVHGRENLPETGGALLVANHVSWVDGALLLALTSRPVRIIVASSYIQGGWRSWVARTMGLIPLAPTPKSIKSAIDTAREALAAGELVCIFPEGGLTPSGQLQAFKPGAMEILRGTDVPVVPIYLDDLWGSIFSSYGGRFFCRIPRRWPRRISIWIGKPQSNPEAIHDVRLRVQNLGVEAVQNRIDRSLILTRRFLRQCRNKLFRLKVADSSGAKLTGGSLLLRTLILRRLLLREVMGPDDKYVGILIPPSVGGVVVNAAVSLLNRVSANLNYTASSEVLNECLRQADIRHVLTSRKVMEKLDLDLQSKLVYLEDFKDKVTLGDKLICMLQAYCLPTFLLERQLGLTKVQVDDPMTVIFTSGSTGLPKGVLLSHRNVLFNVQAIEQIVHLRSDDMVLGILPFFHSFGFSVPLWTALGMNIAGVYHFTPLDAKQVGKLSQQYRATILLATPTFLRSYLRRVEREEFSALEVVVVGAEKMPIELAEAFEEKFGIRPVEGYGTTELAPLVAVNVPPLRSHGDQLDRKEGTVGRPVPGVSVRVVDPDSFAELRPGEPGMLLVTGPNVMLGYLNQPEKTAEVVRDGWYVTGDIAMVDSDGFIKITGRQSRFSKIGGEMVPHLRIEEELYKLVASDEDTLTFAVTAVPDDRKGERLVVLYTELPLSPAEINKHLAEAGLPNLWIPSQDSFLRVDAIPVLGTGKLDLRGLQDLAKQRTAVRV